MRIQADVGKCQGYGNCVALDDRHFDLDDDGLVVLKDDQVSPEQKETVAAAVRSCPAEAIWLAADAG
ncbi:MAG TPA: ferredoxin [Trebonia sp.]|jgi:ferredoxin